MRMYIIDGVFILSSIWCLTRYVLTGFEEKQIITISRHGVDQIDVQVQKSLRNYHFPENEVFPDFNYPKRIISD